MRGFGRRTPEDRRGGDGAGDAFPIVVGYTGRWSSSNYSKEADPSVLVTDIINVGSYGASGNFTQGTSSVRPEVNGNAIRYLGVDEFMASAAISNFFSGAAMTVQMAFQPLAFTGAQADATIYNARCALGDQNGGVGISMRTNAGAEVVAWAFDGASKVVSFVGAVNEKMVISMRHSAGTLYASKNGGAETSVACGTVSNVATALRMGRSFAAAFANFNFYEAITYSTALTDVQMAANAVSLARKWGA